MHPKADRVDRVSGQATDESRRRTALTANLTQCPMADDLHRGRLARSGTKMRP